MSTEQNNPTIVSSYAEGKQLAHEFFQELHGDSRHVSINGCKTNGAYVGQLFEAYTDSGSVDYFYFAIEVEEASAE